MKSPIISHSVSQNRRLLGQGADFIAFKPAPRLPEVDVHCVESAMLMGIGYNSASRTLGVVFYSKAIYHYLDVPRAVYEGLLGARSRGHYFLEHIRGKYKQEKVR